jgi:Cu-Zn family superoxide dismutase
MARGAARISLALTIATFAFGVAPQVVGAQPTPPPAGAVADVKDASGKSLASAEIREDIGKVAISLLLPSPSPLSGKHGFHIMEVGRCEPPNFTSAGGIFNPFGKRHGLLAQGGPMVGDLPNLAMPLQRFNAPALGATLGPGQGSLFGPNGTSLVIFAGEDDGLTDPEGNAGARIACGVIVASGQFAAAQQAGGAPSGNPVVTLGPALIIVLLGAALIGAGLVLRRPRRNP